jgi:hypothetical protein
MIAASLNSTPNATANARAGSTPRSATTFEDVPILKNERHELFAQKLAEGKTATEAYQLAGFRPSRKNASRLRAKEDIVCKPALSQSAAAARSC